MYPKNAPIPPGEEWYYEVDGRAHGPLSKAELDELLNGAGETASDVRVRQGTHGIWSAFQPASPTANYQVHPSPATSPHDELGPQSSVARFQGRSVTGPSRHRWDIGVAFAGLILFNALFLTFWPEPYSRERRYLQALQTITTEAQAMRTKPASDAEWREFSERSKVTLAPIVSDLRKTASSSEPVRQRLLWSARDLIPRTLGPATKERDELEHRLKQYLESAQHDIENR